VNDHDEHSSVIKTPKQLIVVILAAFIVPITVIVLLTQFVTGGISVGKNDPAMSDEAVAKRLKPVGELVLAGSPQAATATAAANAAAAPVAAAPAATGGANSAKSIYDTTCFACHGTGAAGAPKLGDKQAWAPRIKAGNATLYNSALKGKNAMPVKGGNPGLADADVRAVVDYMVSQSR